MAVATLYLTKTNEGLDHISSVGMISTDFIIFTVFDFFFGSFVLFVFS